MENLFHPLHLPGLEGMEVLVCQHYRRPSRRDHLSKQELAKYQVAWLRASTMSVVICLEHEDNLGWGITNCMDHFYDELRENLNLPEETVWYAFSRRASGWPKEVLQQVDFIGGSPSFHDFTTWEGLAERHTLRASDVVAVVTSLLETPWQP